MLCFPKAMSASVRVLIVDDSAEQAERLLAELRRGGFEPVPRRVETREGFEEALNEPWDAVLAHHGPPGFGALPALAVLKERKLDIPFLILSSAIGEDTAVRAMKAGAHNFILKDSLGRLAPTLERELRDAQMRHERRQAHKALSESEARFGTLAETASDAILMVDDASKVLFVNSAAERIFGYPAAAMIGKPLSLLMPGSEREGGRFAPPAREERADGLPRVVELMGRRDGGAEFPLEVSFGIARKDAKPLVTIIARDIGARKAAEALLRQSEERLRTLVGNAPVVLFALDRDGVFTHAEGKGLEALGLRPGKAVGRSVWELYADHPDILDNVRRALGGEGHTATVEVGDLAFETKYAPLRDERGEAAGVIGVATDVTEKRRAEQALSASEARYRSLFERNLAGVYRTTVDGRILDCNESFARIFGYASREEALRYPAWGFYPSAEDRIASLARLRERQTLTNYETCLRRKDGSRVWVLESESLVAGPDGALSVIEGTLIDITERKRAEERVRHLAFHDALTGLPNRLLFNDRVQVALAQANRSRRCVGTLSLDLDRFKMINDSLGHSMGDKLLCQVAERVQGCVRAGDSVARRGADEFTVLVSGLQSAVDAARIAQKILETIRVPFVIDQRELFLTTSIGAAVYPADGQDPETLIRNADTAMYRAKEQGRDNYQLYTPTMNARAAERLALENRLRQALHNEELVVHYQPLVDLRTGRIRGAEALLRWQHPELGLLPPAEFIPLAEISGLIVPIGAWVLKTACAQARAWQQMGYRGLAVAVNLSSRQFQQPDLVRQVTEALQSSALEASCLDLEITESNAMHNAELSIDALKDLKGIGVRISMDDFGTGYSSLNYLKRFPIDRIKIDQSFVRDVTHNPDDAAIASAVIAMAHSLKMGVVAEGVETKEQLAFLRQNRCDEMQGYLFSPPVPALDFERLLKKNSRPGRLPRAREARRAPAVVRTAPLAATAPQPGASSPAQGGRARSSPRGGGLAGIRASRRT